MTLSHESIFIYWEYGNGKWGWDCEIVIFAIFHFQW